MSETEFGTCDICGKKAFLSRTYFYYDIPCRCCGCKVLNRNMHFKLVCHCNDCVPQIPEKTTLKLFSEIDNHEYDLTIEGFKPLIASGIYKL